MKFYSTLMGTLLVACLLATTGCGEKAPEGYSVSGTVSHKGSPVSRGTIMFAPDASAGNSGPAMMYQIVDGKYQENPEDPKRHKGGAYQVRINGFDGNADPGAELPMGKPLFKEYTTKVELPTSDAPNTDFEIKK
ncbi:hypothetical protein DTL21_19445 [Bremerella cremea]|uniref:Carboxypeptidase regulatory-like domain-containing protein n=1 Tax=Blastopirellula marina TaxID=124 RepID=A0A2S8FJQ6_9BACT|nr:MULTISPECIES: hypothetical protein [Pirellulaceae]PQO32396.1 hypothetical protein C5Y83_19425 [Blastopirellula marina]RCS45463.1 hypothetical protein DTL21_19445 [Bremerella cremea]